MCAALVLSAQTASHSMVAQHFAFSPISSAEMILSVFTSTTLAENADALVYCCGAMKNLSNSSALNWCSHQRSGAQSPFPAPPFSFFDFFLGAVQRKFVSMGALSHLTDILRAILDDVRGTLSTPSSPFYWHFFSLTSYFLSHVHLHCN